MSLLEIRDLHAGYGEIEILHGVSLSVEEGRIVTLIGANGAGKTTLLKTISGLIRPSAGEIEFDGRMIARRPPHWTVKAGISQVAEGRAILINADTGLRSFAAASTPRRTTSNGTLPPPAVGSRIVKPSKA